MSRGNLIVISGPSGVGKGTVISLLMDRIPNIWNSISATTRKPREGEVDGQNYYFLTRSQFEDMVEDNGFLEWAEYAGNLYGTPIRSVEEHLEAGQNIILEIDVQGALQIKDIMPSAHLIFIEPPSFEELERRLRGRDTEDEKIIASRLEAAKLELNHKLEYDKQVVNDDIDATTQEIIDYIGQFAD